MTNIKGRLRAAILDMDNFPRMEGETVSVGLAKEALAEIERLEAKAVTDDKCDRWDFDPSTPRILATTVIEELRADNERLRAENQRLNDRVDILVELRKFDRADNERLKAANFHRRKSSKP